MKEKIPNNFVLKETVKLFITYMILAHLDGQPEDYAKVNQFIIEQIVTVINNLRG